MPGDAHADGTDREESRGQTSVDLVVGLTLFLVTITVVLGQLPTFLAPFQEQATPAVGDRAADDVLGQLVVADASADVSTNTLEESCVAAFFEGAGGDDCRFDASESLRNRLGISSLYGVNVSLVRNSTAGPGFEVLCHDGAEVTTCGTDPLRTGQAIPEKDEAVAVTYRGVRVDGVDAVLVVKVWQR